LFVAGNSSTYTQHPGEHQHLELANGNAAQAAGSGTITVNSGWHFARGLARGERHHHQERRRGPRRARPGYAGAMPAA